MGKHKLEPVIVDGDLYNYSTEGKLLGLKIIRHCFRSHMNDKQGMFNVKLTKLKCFRRLSSNNKKKLYISLIKSSMLYPTVPLTSLKNFNIKSYKQCKIKH